MKPDQAAENLQVIRTLMERSAVYRRALAPIMCFNGATGLAGCAACSLLGINNTLTFVELWFSIAAIALSGSFLLIRRQALKDSEPLWSPPTKRVFTAIVPTLGVGALFGTVFLFNNNPNGDGIGIVSIVWSISYGCALHAAGFFTPRGVRVFSWAFLLAGGVAFLGELAFDGGSGKSGQNNPLDSLFNGNGLFMGITFGGLHLAYGIYLYFTESRKTES